MFYAPPQRHKHRVHHHIFFPITENRSDKQLHGHKHSSVAIRGFNADLQVYISIRFVRCVCDNLSGVGNSSVAEAKATHSLC